MSVQESFVFGEGDKATLLLHGFLGSAKNLRSLARAWSNADPGRRIYGVDLPGHGGGPALGENPDLESLATPLLPFCEQKGISAVVGHSLGGRVALRMAGLRPSAFRDITLLDISPSPGLKQKSPVLAVLPILLRAPDTSDSQQSMVDVLCADGLGVAMARWLVQSLVRNEDGGFWEWSIDRKRLAQLHDRVTEESLWDVAEALGASLGCIRGGESSFVSDKTLDALAQFGAGVQSVEGAGHFLHIDKPKGLLEALLTLYPGEKDGNA